MSAINQHPAYLDRQSDQRGSATANLWRTSRIVEIRDGQIRATGDEITFLSPEDASSARDEEKYFLGRDHDSGETFFAWDRPDSFDGVSESEMSAYQTLRNVGASLGGRDVELALHAVALHNWHKVHQFCARCGAQTKVSEGGAVRICTVDGSQHHPRTDGAVIVLVRDQHDRILLGHNPNWPDNRYSTFAGFLEPGETFEQCVVREVREESGVEVSGLNYLGSQPWPFPASIMIAFEAMTSAPDQAKADGVEITDVRWFTREELKVASANGEILLPPLISVARKMIERWFAQGDSSTLVGGESWRS